jgi:hypothetical protein
VQGFEPDQRLSRLNLNDLNLRVSLVVDKMLVNYFSVDVEKDLAVGI